MASEIELVIRPRKGWQPIDLRELWHYRQLLGFLIWRDVRIRYSQTILGGLWAVVQPLLAMVIFTALFHRMAGIQSDGPPYPLFAFVGLTAWIFFSNAVSASASSLIGNQQLISKVYFPRVLIPLAAIGAFVLDLAVNLVIVAGMMLYYRWPLSANVAWIPLCVLEMLIAATGMGLILAALNVHYRDVKYAVPFFMQLGLFVTPVIYSLGDVPERFHLVLGLNPMTGVVEGFRHGLLASSARWGVIGESVAVSLVLLVLGLYLFRRMERRFADVI
jgi:homopolymeric O-antigen transport system permease protein